MSNTIVKGPFESNRSLAKFETLIELKRILRDKKVLENLKFKNVYEYLLLVGEWMRQYQIVFSYEIKEKFVDTFRKICAYYRWI